MQNELLRAAWAEIDLDAFRYNIENIKKLVKPGVEMIGVVKADGYGCDSVVIANVLMEEGVKRFAVATLEEGIKLRRGIKDVMIVVLGLLPDKFADKVVEYDLTPTVDSYSNAKAFSDAAVKAGKRAGCFVAVDSGMGRIGLIADDPEQADVVRQIADLPNLAIEAVSTHFSTADWYDKGYAHLQQKKFDAFYTEIEKRGVKGLPRTASNSAGIMELPEADYEMVRPGIFMYGHYPSNEVDRRVLDIKPIKQIKASIVKLKDVPRGTSVGYNRKFIAMRDSRIATIEIGYADGLSRSYSDHAKVIVGGMTAPVAGSICMDQFMVDVTDVPNVRTGDEVIVMGTDGVNTITGEEIAAAEGTIVNELFTVFGQRLPKVYRGLHI
ncbi:MAG: alanine racemase [Eubacteriaceae bacterium]|jgi:alanine racemase|nr:alanine racemase [Eubacteriaceae bacterium]